MDWRWKSLSNPNTIFYNADYIVVEYIDLIKSPYLILLDMIRRNPRMKEILKIEEIEFLNDAALYEWYLNRKHQNFFFDLNKYPDQISNDALAAILDDQLSLSLNFYKQSKALPMLASLKAMKTKKICRDIIIYHPHKNFHAKNDLDSILHEDFIWMTRFEDVMKKAGSNSTYFLSDIHHIEEMKNAGVLKMSSVTLPIEYRYNKKNMTDFDIDYEELMKETPFKLSYMYACRYETEIGGNINGIS